MGAQAIFMVHFQNPTFATMSRIAVLAISVRGFEDDGCLTGFAAGGAAKKYLMVEAAENEGAVCLDGTPGAYYFQQGSGDGVNKWYIHHQGGGWCESMDDCWSRSN